MSDTTADDTTDTGDVDIDTTDPADSTEPQPDTAADVAKWKSLARKHETQAKANAAAAKELEALKAANKTETEKAVEEAEQRGRSAATADFGQRLAAAEVKAALTGVVPDPGAIVEDLNLTKYVTDTGDVDMDAVTALRSKYQALAAKPPVPDLKPGKQGSHKPDLEAQIAAAEAAGDTKASIRLKTQALRAGQ